MKKTLLLFVPVLFLSACGGVGERNYSSRNPADCEVIRFQCEDGATIFSDDTGCGCIVPQGIRAGGNGARHYLSRDLAVCSKNTFICDNNTKGFTDDTGCGCEEMTEEEKAAQADDMVQDDTMGDEVDEVMEEGNEDME